MRSEVMYRDLPGGPLLVKFADEVSLWCLCSKCGMFSKDMFQDSASHVFCSVCIFECSAQKKIHCKHERRDVPVDDMVQAVDVGHVMRDQIVFCPNRNDGNGCAEFCALKDLEGHYLKCAETKINCLQCGSEIKGPDWERHIRSCPQEILQCQHCVVAVPRRLLQAHERLCYGNPETRHTPQNTAPVSDSSNSCSKSSPRQESKLTMDSAEDNAAPANETQLFRSDVATDDNVLQCVHCKRNVKRKNMEQHVLKCPKNKVLSAVSTVTNLPGNVEGAQDSRNTPTAGSTGFPRESSTLQNSFASCDSQWEIPWEHFGEPTDVPCVPTGSRSPGTDVTAQEALRLPSISDLPGVAVSAVTFIPKVLVSTVGGIMNFVSGSSAAEPATLQESNVAPRVPSLSSFPNQYEECPPRWPAEPSYQNVSDWIEQHDSWLQRSGITNEVTKFFVLLNKTPKNVSGAFLNIQDEPRPYTEAKSRILQFFEKKRPE